MRLRSPSTSILDPSAIELCCVSVFAIWELLLLTLAAAASTARPYLGSGSGGIGMSFNFCGSDNSLAVFPISSLLLAFSLHFFGVPRS